MRHQTLRHIQRTLALIILAALLSILAITAQVAGYDFSHLLRLLPAGILGAAFNRHIAIISGHAGSDSGAICTDDAGNPTVQEAEITAKVTDLVAQRLRWRGATVQVLNEFDPRLDQLQADLLLSLHADSCIGESGYKATTPNNRFPLPVEKKLLACIEEEYPGATGLTLHANTITHDMTDYHAFRQIAPETPAAILELGFLGGDQTLLIQEPGRVATGVLDAILCFLAVE